MMRYSLRILFPFLISDLAVAHGGIKLLGGSRAINFLAPRAANLFESAAAPFVHALASRQEGEAEARQELSERDASTNTNGPCGVGSGSCAPGYW